MSQLAEFSAWKRSMVNVVRRQEP